MTISEYERQRQEKIAQNQALLKSLGLGVKPAVLATTTKTQPSGSAPKKSAASAAAAPKPRPRPKKRAAESPVDSGPRRQSKRLRGLPAEGEPGGQAPRPDADVKMEDAPRERPRIDERVAVGGWKGGLLSGGSGEWEEEEDEDVWEKGSGDPAVVKLREKMGKLAIWKDVNPNNVVLTPERVYSIGFHPTTTKPLVFGGDKVGNFGIFDGSQSVPVAEDDDDDETDPKASFFPETTTEQIHARSVSAVRVSPDNDNTLFTASYDGTIRQFDLAKGVSTEVYAPYAGTGYQSDWNYIGISDLRVAKSRPFLLYYTTLSGQFGIHDVRMRSPSGGEPELTTVDSKGELRVQLLEKKIGGFSISPANPDIIATASLDRTLRIWDLRKMVAPKHNRPEPGPDEEADPDEDRLRVPSLLATCDHRLSVSHADFSQSGLVSVSSYDDTVAIYDFSKTCAGAAEWTPGKAVPSGQLKPAAVIRHNNQTGRWVSILKPHWQESPADGLGDRLCIGNMGRWVDVYSGCGGLVATLTGTERAPLKAVPAVCSMHPERPWVVGGNARGRVSLWV